MWFTRSAKAKLAAAEHLFDQARVAAQEARDLAVAHLEANQEAIYQAKVRYEAQLCALSDARQELWEVKERALALQQAEIH